MIKPIRVYLHYEEGVLVTWRSIWKVKKKERKKIEKTKQLLFFWNECERPRKVTFMKRIPKPKKKKKKVQ
jgi:hypothetical protein